MASSETPPDERRHLRLTTLSEDEAANYTTALLTADDDQFAADAPDTIKIYSTPTEAMRIFSTKRSELLEAVIDEPADSISALADRIDRSHAEVSRNLKRLDDAGLISYESTGDGRAKRVSCPYDVIDIVISIGAVEDESSDEQQ